MTKGNKGVPVSRKGLQKRNEEAVTAAKSRAERDAEVARLLPKPTGTLTMPSAERVFTQAVNAMAWPKAKPDEAVVAGFSILCEMAPKTRIEAMLAVQMLATHDAALAFLHRATLPDQEADRIDAIVTRATRLMRLFTEQLEAMQKLKGMAGQQRVTVEHVHVHEGGQAIVGAVSANRGAGEGVRGDDRSKTP